MKRISKNRKKRQDTTRLGMLFLLLILFCTIVVLLPLIQTKLLTYGANIPFTPVPAKGSLQLEWFSLPSPTAIPSVQPINTGQPVNSNQPINSNQPVNQSNNPVQPVISAPASSVGKFPPAPAISPFKSNGQLCSQGNNSGKVVTDSCYCADLTVTCQNGNAFGADGKMFPMVNPCGTKVAPGNGRYCVEKPVIYLYPTVPTFVDVKVLTSGHVVISDPEYPIDGWNQVLANPDGTLQYKGKGYSELFYETSVNNFQKPQQGMTIATVQLSEKLNTILDRLGLIGREKKEFISYWLPRLYALHSPYVFFSVISPSAKANLDTVVITPKPDTQIAFIAYFKPVSQPANDTLQLSPSPVRRGFVSVEWGGVINEK